MKYRAVVGSRLRDKDAEIAGPELDRLARENEGRLTAALVLTAASAKKSPLRQFFEWDDSVAAVKYRLDQARHLIRSIRVVVEDADGETDVRAMHLVIENSEASFASIDDILESPDLLGQIIANAKRELEVWINKHQRLRRLEALAPVFDEIERVVKPQPDSTRVTAE